MLIVPPGVVHAYQNVGEIPGLVCNFANRLYRGPGRSRPWTRSGLRTTLIPPSG